MIALSSDGVESGQGQEANHDGDSPRMGMIPRNDTLHALGKRCFLSH
jgi:hypothetical protein